MGAGPRVYGWQYETAVKLLSDPDTAAIALAFLRGGHVIAVPTDTVYHLAADGLNPDAVEILAEMQPEAKGRDLVLLLADIADVWHVAAYFPSTAYRLARTYWPGPLVLKLSPRRGLPEMLLDAEGRVAVRVPDQPWLRELVRQLGRPLAAVPAYGEGGQVASTADEVLRRFRGRIPLVVDAGPTRGEAPLAVVDCTAAEPVVLEAGPLDEKAVLGLGAADKEAGDGQGRPPQSGYHSPSRT